MKRIIVSITFLFLMFEASHSESGCPDAEEIQPCVCTNSPTTYLQCSNINSAERLRQVFLNSARYKYKEVHIEYSSLQYLPHDLFENAPTSKLFLKNVTLIDLFDSPPVALEDLDTLHIEDTKLIRGIVWDILKPLKSLRILDIYYNSIATLGESFANSATKNLEQLTFYSTRTKAISPGTLVEFTKLTKLACDAGQLKHVSRDIFTNPFEGSVIYFNDNKISTIPDDMFTNMPNLQTLGLRNNQIAVIPETAFCGTGLKLEYFRLDGNPLKCDCRLLWLIQKKPPVLGGECSSPKHNHGKQLQDLQESDFNC